MSKLVSVMLVFWLFTSAVAQDIGIEAGFGMASSRMEDMKYLQEYILGTYPVEGKIISSFPAYTAGSIGLVRQLSLVQIGAGYSFIATGGRTNYTDYSGSISTDMLAKSHRLGAWVSYAFFSRDRYDLFLYGQVDANISRISINSSVNALGYYNGLTSNYGSFSPTGTAGLKIYINFDKFSLGLDGGYRVDKPGGLSDTEDGDDLTDPADRQRTLTSDWTGWCVQAKVLFWFKPF